MRTVTGRLEHYNITTSDYEGMKTFFLTLFDNYQVRHENYLDPNTSPLIKYAHVGDENTYVAIQATPEGETFQPLPDHYFNHYCFIVDNMDETKERLSAMNISVTSGAPHPYRKRIYFKDFDGNRFEFIEYLTGDYTKDHSYQDDPV